MRVRVNESQRVNIQGSTGSHVLLRLFEEAWCFCSRATWHFFLGPEFVVRLVYIISIVGLCTLFLFDLFPISSVPSDINRLVGIPKQIINHWCLAATAFGRSNRQLWGKSGLKFDWAVAGCSPDEGDLRVPGCAW